MDKLSLQDRRDFPLTTNSLAFMQAAYAALEKLGYIGGDNYIVSGCVVTGSSVAPGYMFLNGILMPFIGGSVASNVQIVKTVTQINVDAGVREQTSYRAEFGTSTDPLNNVAWANIAKMVPLQDKVSKESGKSLVDPTAVTSTGMLMPWAGVSSNVPAGWLLCNGALVSRITYAALFGIIGIKYGGGDGVDTFQLPNMNGRIPLGATQDSNVGTPNYANGYGVGQQIGSDTHTLTVAQMPSHNHTGTTDKPKALNAANLSNARVVSPNSNPSYSGRIADSSDWHLNNLDQETVEHGHDFTTANKGDGSAHENRQPSLAMYYIIKA